MTALKDHGEGPYVGPRAFREGERLYGRDRESRELLNLLISERVVLLVAPSGAGKTSLIRASLAKALVHREFHVFPNARVGGEPPGGANEALAQANRYLLSALQSLDVPAASPTSLERLASVSFADHVRSLADPSQSRVLIFDQFEEILTVDPAAVAQKEAFFDQVGAALTDRRLWALFSMREEFMAALEPYLDRLPTRLATTFRLDLLGPEAAAEAIRRPARAENVEFTADAANHLIGDLRKMRVQRLDGLIDDVPGPYVEPVQLQVVCRLLWAHARPDPSQITVDDVKALGDIDQVLEHYYSEAVAKASRESGQPERVVRAWIESRLITEQRMRSQVLKGSESSIAAAAVESLLGSYLVRAEERHGATWYELAHDRLIRPIRASNAAWFERNLQPFQRQARAWSQSKRASSLLIDGVALKEAEGWAKTHVGDVSSSEQEFLKASRTAADSAASQRQRQLYQILLGGLVVFLVILGALLLKLLNVKREIEQANVNLGKQQSDLVQANAALGKQKSELEQANAALDMQKGELKQANIDLERKKEIATNGAKIVLAYNFEKVIEGGVTNASHEKAREAEKEGFEELLAGKLDIAAAKYGEACKADCLYMNVHEIHYKLLAHAVPDYLLAAIDDDQPKLRSIQRQVLIKLQEHYLGGTPPADYRLRVNAALQRLSLAGVDGGLSP